MSVGAVSRVASIVTAVEMFSVTCNVLKNQRGALARIFHRDTEAPIDDLLFTVLVNLQETVRSIRRLCKSGYDVGVVLRRS